MLAVAVRRSCRQPPVGSRLSTSPALVTTGAINSQPNRHTKNNINNKTTLQPTCQILLVAAAVDFLIAASGGESFGAALVEPMVIVLILVANGERAFICYLLGCI